MCGIAGAAGGPSSDAVARMADALDHRGPDGRGAYRSPDGLVELASRRLAIIDVAGGAQPVSNEDGTVWVVYNGEIYNHAELRSDLEARGHRFRSRCDTEVLVHLYEEHGAALVERLNGEFAFALFDARAGRLLLARDRLGIRPLYYAERAGLLLFASELKALLRSGLVAPRVRVAALDRYLSLRYAFGAGSMIDGVERLPAAHVLEWTRGSEPRLRRYWKVPEPDPEVPFQAAVEELDGLLRDSVRRRLESDVPLGIYLSGGVDSTLVVALAAAATSQLETFSIGFGLELDETAAASATAERFGARHTEIRLEADSYRQLPAIAAALDEPIGDGIVVPTYCLARAARRKVAVVLTGEGADEVFGGYVHHRALHLLDGYRRRVPRLLRAVADGALAASPGVLLDRLFPYPAKLGTEGRRRVLDVLAGTSGYLDLVQLFDAAQRPALCPVLAGVDASAWAGELATTLASGPGGTALGRLLASDIDRWLPDYTLLKQDRLTMAHSVEGRVPYLDHRVVELVSRLPDRHKVRGLTSKRLLREVARRHLGATAAGRRKRAFYLPVGRFFDGGFAAFVRDTLGADAVARDGFFAPRAVAGVVEEGLRGQLVAEKRLMAILIYTLWVRAHGAHP